MSNVDKENKDCQDGVCEVTFKPFQAARRSFQNLKALASDLMDKVKCTLSGESQDTAESDGAAKTDEDHLDRDDEEKMQVASTQQSQCGTDTGDFPISTRSSEILDDFIQRNWKPLPGAGQMRNTNDHLKMVHVRPRPAEGQIEAPRYSNPWRIDSHH